MEIKRKRGRPSKADIAAREAQDLVNHQEAIQEVIIKRRADRQAVAGQRGTCKHVDKGLIFAGTIFVDRMPIEVYTLPGSDAWNKIANSAE
jgi:hypothetical protein